MHLNNTTPPPMGWNFDNSYAALPELFYSRLAPVPVRAPKLVIFNRHLAAELGLDPHRLQSDEGVNILAGNALPEGAQPLAQAYAGHQFGHFTTLGDGRAILLGEQITPTGERRDIQLKGSGRTPFSRQGDGRAALGPMLREYVISEAMYALDIPTTRSLAVVASGEPVRRETLLPGAVLTRVAASHLRVGTFEYAAWQGTPEQVRMLADYSIRRHYPEAAQQENPYLAFFEAVMERQAALIVQWLLVGFIHGVMNTDNMAISGETIDYGPCAFMDIYDPATVFSSIDQHGRYAFANQAHIAQWNLARFAETLLPLFADGQEKAIDLAHTALKGFEDRFQAYWLKGMRAKLGLADAQEGDSGLIEELLKIMQRLGADYTNSFRDLAREASPDNALFQDGEFQSWQQRWQARLDQQGKPLAEVRASMDAHNPAVIPRNHRVEEALAAAAEDEDIKPLEKLLGVLATPYAEPAEADQAYRQPPEPSNRVYQTFCGT